MPTEVAVYGKFLREELNRYDRNGFYDVPEDELWAVLGKNIPSVGDLEIGVEEIQSYRSQTIGRAALSDGRAFDIPLVDFGISASKVGTMLVIAGAEWSFVDIERAKIANRGSMSPSWSWVEAKANAVRDAVNRRIHELVIAGSAETGFTGFFNSGVIDTLDETGTAVFSLTADQRLEWMQTILADFKTSSKLMYSSITAYVSDDLHRALGKRFTDGTGDTALKLLLNAENGRMVGAIEPITELAPATLAALGIVPNANTGLMVLGDFSQRSVKRHYAALDRTEPFPKDTGVHFGLTGWAATSEVDFKVPERFLYVKYNATKP